MPTLGYACEEAVESDAVYGLKEHIGSGQKCLWLRLPTDGKAATLGNGTCVALLAQRQEQVDSFYSAALAVDASDEGAPGLRDVHPHFYAAYVKNPDGHKLVVVCHQAEGKCRTPRQRVKLVGRGKLSLEIREYLRKGRPSWMALFIHEV